LLIKEKVRRSSDLNRDILSESGFRDRRSTELCHTGIKVLIDCFA
jgi:hypothetical protein